MNPLQLLLYACLVLFACAQFPGPQKTETINGEEVWKAKPEKESDDTLIYKVNDLQGRGARPKLVYNCHKVPALCKTSRGSLNGGSTAVRHYDRDSFKERTASRRESSCPGTWLDSHTCPESDQPPEFWYQNGKTVSKWEVKMWKGQDGQGDASENQLARLTGIKHDRDGIIKEHWSKLGAKLTCDEWPAASWIEGGSGAKTYCAPLAATCNQNVKALNTEQNWQSQAHNQFLNWYKKFEPHQWDENIYQGPDLDIDLNFEIFKFDFELVNEPGTNYGTWIEAAGRKRYCFPKGVNGAADCKTEWTEDPDDFFIQES
ncbi:hypothetical protein FE257_013079 [Aspergillus nanangensis]|uniref:Uncharacterized protein n=1 Tax=Aspergillus nanangensis TaxID=2582783 RepID=A0AAD4GQA0_ASPNN|nr:hypothetical protein FE257_013079 [Aspergillus nanangensis]